MPLSLDLSEYAGKKVNVVFNTHESPPGRPRNGMYDFAVFGAPRIVVGRRRDRRGVRPIVFERFLRRPAEKEGLDYYLQRLAEGADRLDVVQGIVVGDEFLGLLMRQAFGTHVGSPLLAFAPPGHYYSPIPSRADVERWATAKWQQPPER